MTASPVLVNKTEGNAAFTLGSLSILFVRGLLLDAFLINWLGVYAAGDYSSAEAAYSAALQLCSDQETAAALYSNRAAARLELGLYKEALQDAQLSRQSNPYWDKVPAHSLPVLALSSSQPWKHAHTAERLCCRLICGRHPRWCACTGLLRPPPPFFRASSASASHPTCRRPLQRCLA